MKKLNPKIIIETEATNKKTIWKKAEEIKELVTEVSTKMHHKQEVKIDDYLSRIHLKASHICKMFEDGVL